MTTTYHSGYDHFTPDPGEWESCTCKACNAEMDVKRDCEGPTSSIMAMAKSSRKYDSFSCPNSHAGWHKQIIAILQELRSTSSSVLKTILQQEVNSILITKIATLEKFKDNINQPVLTGE